jgi:hypothetical protein
MENKLLMENYDTLVEQYHTRKLTYDNDVIDAFLGLWKLSRINSTGDFQSLSSSSA